MSRNARGHVRFDGRKGYLSGPYICRTTCVGKMILLNFPKRHADKCGVFNYFRSGSSRHGMNALEGRKKCICDTCHISKKCIEEIITMRYIFFIYFFSIYSVFQSLWTSWIISWCPVSGSSVVHANRRSPWMTLHSVKPTFVCHLVVSFTLNEEQTEHHCAQGCENIRPQIALFFIHDAAV